MNKVTMLTLYLYGNYANFIILCQARAREKVTMQTLWYEGKGITLYLAREKVTMLTLRYHYIPCQGIGNYANIMI